MIPLTSGKSDAVEEVMSRQPRSASTGTGSVDDLHPNPNGRRDPSQALSAVSTTCPERCASAKHNRSPSNSGRGTPEYVTCCNLGEVRRGHLGAGQNGIKDAFLSGLLEKSERGRQTHQERSLGIVLALGLRPTISDEPVDAVRFSEQLARLQLHPMERIPHSPDSDFPILDPNQNRAALLKPDPSAQLGGQAQLPCFRRFWRWRSYSWPKRQTGPIKETRPRRYLAPIRTPAPNP